jgi:hypothetical protein
MLALAAHGLKREPDHPDHGQVRGEDGPSASKRFNRKLLRIATIGRMVWSSAISYTGVAEKGRPCPSPD